MEGDDPIHENGRPVDRAELRRAAGANRAAVQFFLDWEAGRFHLGLEEYLMLPATAVEARAIFDKFQIDRAKEEAKNRKRRNAHKP